MTFLLVLSITIALGYSIPISNSPAFEDDATDLVSASVGPSAPTTLWESMRRHACEMLTHYLIVVGARFNVRFKNEVQKKLITSASSQWGKQGPFTWIPTKPSLHELDSEDDGLATAISHYEHHRPDYSNRRRRRDHQLPPNIRRSVQLRDAPDAETARRWLATKVTDSAVGVFDLYSKYSTTQMASLTITRPTGETLVQDNRIPSGGLDSIAHEENADEWVQPGRNMLV